MREKEEVSHHQKFCNDRYHNLKNEGEVAKILLLPINNFSNSHFSLSKTHNCYKELDGSQASQYFNTIYEAHGDVNKLTDRFSHT